LYTYDIAKHQRIDLISSGNHELYKANSSNGEFYHTVPNYKHSYLASNLDIYNPDTGKLEPLAPRFKKFATKNQGIRILAFGFIFDFTGNANNTVIHTVQDTVKEEWFKAAIRDEELDLIIVFGHVDVRSHEYATIYSTIRAVQPSLPIQIFGGHSHIRDYKVYDDKSVALESGRYMETIGFLSINGLTANKRNKPAGSLQKAELEFSRLYIDNNLFSLQRHSNKHGKSFHTDMGLQVSKQIHEARKELNLDQRYGCAPQDLWVSRVPYPNPNSIFTWLEQQVIPDQAAQSHRVKDGKKALVITNTGGMRFDIFKGPFTKDTTYLVSPFTSGLRYIKDVPFKSASKVLKLLNNEGPILDSIIQNNAFLAPPEHLAMRLRPDRLMHGRHEDVARPLPNAQVPMEDSSSLIPGYTTIDDDGEDGDDTIHSPIRFYDVPNCIQAKVGFEEESIPEKVDLVYNEFIQPWIILALQFLGGKYGKMDTAPYLGSKSFTTIITDWVSEHWNVTDETCP
jgi:hypothetical protein